MGDGNDLDIHSHVYFRLTFASVFVRISRLFPWCRRLFCAMPFLKGVGALRRTKQFLDKSSIILRDDVKVLTFSVAARWDGHGMGPETVLPEFQHHDGLYKFVFWNLPQLQYKNPNVQMVTFRKITPTPWIKAYLEDDTDMLIDCDSRSREEIYDHLKAVLGKTDKM